jgi:hypothetical protein
MQKVQEFGSNRYPVIQLLHSAVNQGLKSGQLTKPTRTRFDPNATTSVDRVTGVWTLNPKDLHLMPMLYNIDLMFPYFNNANHEINRTYHRPNTRIAELALTLTQTVPSEELMRISRETKIKSTLIHSMSLAPTRTFHEQLRTNVAFQSKWNSKDNLYSSAHEWFSLTHAQIRVDDAFKNLGGCAIGSFLSNEEIVSICTDYDASPYFQRMIFDTFKVMQYIQKNKSFQFKGPIPTEKLKHHERDDTVDILDPDPNEQWDWFKNKRGEIVHEVIKSSPVKIECKHGTLYTHTTTIIVSIAAASPVLVPELDKNCHGLKAVFTVVTESLDTSRLPLQNRINGGHFKDIMHRLKPNTPLSQHITVKLGYGEYVVPTKEDISSMPVCFKVATVNAGFMEVQTFGREDGSGDAHRSIMWPGGSVDTDEVAGIAHIIGQGLPITIAIGNDSFSDLGNKKPNLFTHDIAFTQPTLNTHFFLLVQLMQCIRETRLRTGFTKSLMAPWAKLLNNNDARNPVNSEIENTSVVLNDMDGMAIGDDYEDDEHSEVAKRFQARMEAEPLFQNKEKELLVLINHIMRNVVNASFGHSLADMLSIHSHTSTDGGLIVLGEDSLFAEVPDRSNIAMVFVPVANIHTTPGLNRWIPTFENTFVGMPQSTASMNMGAPLNVEAQPFNPWASDGTAAMRREMHLDAHWSPTTELSGFADLDLDEVYGLAAKSSVFDS